LSYLPSEVSELTSVQTLDFPHSYALYPFLSPRSLPWTMNTSGTFRIRRVGEWLGRNAGENIAATGGLAAGRGRVLTSLENPVDLRDVLLGSLPAAELDSARRHIKASMGHMLFTTMSTDQRPTIVPPLRGHHTYGKILKWIAGEDVKFSFVSSLPAVLIDSSPAEQKVLHRLTYHALPKLDPNYGSSDTPSSAKASTPYANKVITFEVVLAQPRQSPLNPEVDNDLVEDLNADVPLLDASSTAQCTVGVEASADLMMPDRPMDLRLTAVEAKTLAPGEGPAPLQSYMDDLRKFMMKEDSHDVQPDPPLLFDHAGDTYMLHTSASIKQSIEVIRVPSDGDGVLHEPTTIRAVSESILDLESNQKSIRCEVACDNYLADDAWKRFLGDCDKLTTSTYRPVGSIPDTNIASM